MLKSLRSLVAFAGCSLMLVSAAHNLQAATVTLQANRDNFIMQTTVSAYTPSQQLNDVNNGAVPYEQIGTAGGNDTDGKGRYIASFDEPSMPAFSQINSVTLRMFHWVVPGVTNVANYPFSIEVHSIAGANANWVEGTGAGLSGPDLDSGSTWNRKSEPGSLNWAGSAGLTSPGLDYEVTTLASHTFNAAPADGEAIDYVFTGSTAALTALIQGWDSLNPGFVLFHTPPTNVAGNVRLLFHSREAGDFNLRPQLIINFEEPLPAPEPSSMALLGLGLVGLMKRRRR